MTWLVVDAAFFEGALVSFNAREAASLQKNVGHPKKFLAMLMTRCK
jgi:hypothetical protein